MANGSGGFEALQNVAPNVFPPIYIPNGGGGGNGSGASNESATEAIEREYVEDYVFQAAFSLVYLLIFTLGVFGNVLVVYVVWANKHMRTVTNIFIVNLAVSDIMLCGLAVPFTPLYTFTGERSPCFFFFLLVTKFRRGKKLIRHDRCIFGVPARNRDFRLREISPRNFAPLMIYRPVKFPRVLFYPL